MLSSANILSIEFSVSESYTFFLLALDSTMPSADGLLGAFTRTACPTPVGIPNSEGCCSFKLRSGVSPTDAIASCAWYYRAQETLASNGWFACVREKIKIL